MIITGQQPPKDELTEIFERLYNRQISIVEAAKLANMSESEFMKEFLPYATIKDHQKQMRGQ